MTDAHFDFDVAFSFLDADKSLALALELKLQPNLDTFVYSTRQQILAGTDALESFRNIFLSRTRLVVVLYRIGWGETKFTRIEERAIRDRGFDQHWEDFLLFVTLNDIDAVPGWLPTHHIRLSYPTYGLDQLIGAIKLRAQSVGAYPRTEDAVRKAVRLNEESKVRQEREQALSGNEGLGFAQAEAVVAFDTLEQRLAGIRTAVPALGLEWCRDQIREFEIRSTRVSLNIVPVWEYPLDTSRLQAFEFVGRIRFPNDPGFSFPGPKNVGHNDYFVEFNLAFGGWCWKNGRYGELMTSHELAEDIAQAISELHARADRGEIKIGLDDWLR